jgi:peptidoglycan/LPS O-acetylase OafA/YrhL
VKYRQEIDGLRALAVIPVIFFHAGFETFSGGYVGVDVFFVISGYLIASLILAEQQAGQFSLSQFYERRARRILPALFAVMLACLPFAYLWLLPSDMRSLSQSLTAVAAFVSNVLFWQSSGYFRPAAELVPLLHTWSLAVEEQFYLAFPLLMWLTRSWGHRRFWLLLLLLLLSLGLAQGLLAAKPSAVFFLLPTRGWEILLGVLAAFVPSSHRLSSRHGWGSLLGGMGLALIVTAVLCFDKNTPFPGGYALLPTLGAMLVIIFATSQSLVGRLLGHRLVAGIGLISYSAYLWHQPVLAFTRYRLMREPDSFEMTVLLLMVGVLAYGTWRFIETPFRDRQRIPSKKIVLYAALGSLFFLVIGVAGYRTNGFSFSDPARNNPFQACHEQNMKDGLCIFGRQDAAEAIVLVGDSHAGHLSKALIQAFGDKYKIILITCSSCFLGGAMHFDKVATDPDALAAKRTSLEKLRSYKIKAVVRGQRWQGYGLDSAEEIRAAIADARLFLGIPYERMIILGSPLEIDYRCHAVNYYHLFDAGKCRIDHRSRAVNMEFTRVTGQIAAAPKVVFVYPAKSLCPRGECRVISDGALNYLDRHHLSLTGAIRIVAEIEQVIHAGESNGL